MVSRSTLRKNRRDLVHYRLCHRSNGYLKKNCNYLYGIEVVPGDYDDLEDNCSCDACARTKSKLLPRQKEIKERRNHDGEVATDLYGPFPTETLQGSNHIQAFLRISSGYVILFGCNRKSDVVKNLEEYLKHWPPPRTTSYHSDGAKELISADVQKVLERFSPAIAFSFSTAYSPNQNSFVERFWRTVADMSHPNLLLAELPFVFIEFAFQYAAYVYNRLPRKTEKGWMSPYEAEFGKKPDLSMCRRWGCSCYYHVPSQLQRKGVIENGIKGYFMGVSKTQPYGWEIWDPKLNDIIVSSNVKFIESVGERVTSEKSSNKLREVDFYYRQVELVEEHPESYQHLVGKKYYDRDEREVFVTTSVVKRGQVIVGNRKKVVRGKPVGSENDNHCVYVKDIVKMIEDKSFADLVLCASTTQRPFTEIDHLSGPAVNDSSSESYFRRRCARQKSAPQSSNEAVFLTHEYKPSSRERESLPKDIPDALTKKRARKWYDGMYDECNYIVNIKNVMYEWLLPLPDGVIPLGTKFVFKVKEKEDPEDDIYRARLVAQGFDQIFGVNYDEVFSPTTRANTFRLFLYFVLLFDMSLPIHLDATKAFMNSDIDYDIWVLPPKDPDEIFFKKGSVYKLNKCLYGIHQASAMWFKDVEKMLFDLGFKNLQAEPCFFYTTKGGVLTFIIIYVDDILITSQLTTVRDAIARDIQRKFEFTSDGVVSEFLGINISFCISEKFRYILLDQEKMILEKCEEFGLLDEPSVSLPMNPQLKLLPTDPPASKDFPFRQLVGSALHIARWTRCDISYAVSNLSRFSSNPTVSAAKAACQLWIYLRSTSRLKFRLSLSDVIKSNFIMVGMSDSDWARDQVTRRSTTGWMVFIGLALINWVSQLQSFIAQSSMEAETIAANKLLNEIILMQNMFKEANLLPISHTGTPMMIDNQAAIQAAYNSSVQGKTKHFDIQQFNLREKTASGRVIPTKVHTNDNVSDMLTKPLDIQTLSRLRPRAGLVDDYPKKKIREDKEWK